MKLNCATCIIKFSVALTILDFGQAVVKKWKFTNNIMDPQNWVGGKPSENCRGVIFPLNMGSVGSVSQLYADEVVLPVSGEIEIKDGGFIEIKENSPCLRIKELQHYYWFSPDSWDSTNNTAVPDIEKVPCMEDDVVFPADDTVSVIYPEMPVQIHALQIGGKNMTNDEWQHFLQTDYGDYQFLTPDEFEMTGINIQKVICLNPSGCFCHDIESDVTPWICEKVAKRAAPCFDPVIPIGHCNEICGGIIHLTVTMDFVLSEIMSKVPKYETIDLYASKVLQKPNVYIQIVFVDKHDYNGLSTNAAYELHKTILRDSPVGVITSTLYTSGMRIPSSSSWFIIVLATLLVSCVLCITVYIFYEGSLQNLNIISRLPIREVSFKNVRPLWFSKFENREEGRMSMATSFVSLDKAFDNPMYGAHRPSISSETMEAVALIEGTPSTSKTTHSNPMYGENEQIEAIEVIEEREMSQK